MMDDIDKLLAQIKEEYTEAKPNFISGKPKVSSSEKSAFGIDKLLSDIKADFEAEERILQLQRQQELEAQRVRIEELKQKQCEGLKQEAKVWLEQLEPLSPEGIWFESFASSYPSQLDAAVEYLQGLD
jgi:hypothetical protein